MSGKLKKGNFMKNIMIFIAIIIGAIFAYQAFAPTLIKHGVDMNVTSFNDNSEVEEMNRTASH
jgi:hypothetical protein